MRRSPSRSYRHTASAFSPTSGTTRVSATRMPANLASVIDGRPVFGPPETAAGVEHLAFETADRCPGADLVDDFAELLRLLQSWQRTLGTRSVSGLRCRYTERTK